MNNPDLLRFLNTFSKIRIIEAYTGRHLCYQQTPWDCKEVIRIAEVRFRANEMPEVYYETDHALKMVKDGTIFSKSYHPALSGNREERMKPTTQEIGQCANQNQSDQIKEQTQTADHS